MVEIWQAVFKHFLIVTWNEVVIKGSYRTNAIITMLHVNVKNISRCDSNGQLRKQNGSLKSFNSQLKSWSETFQILKPEIFWFYSLNRNKLIKFLMLNVQLDLANMFSLLQQTENKGHGTLLLCDLSLDHSLCFSKGREILIVLPGHYRIHMASRLWNLTNKKYEVL